MDERSTILIVDDDESTCETLALIFRKKGYETRTARTGREAIEEARGRFFNVALLDIKLPDVDGVELLASLKELHPHMVLIMVTAYASLETAVRALNEGASAYVTKPLDMDEVLVTIREALDKQHLIMENRRLYEAAQRELAERKRAEEALRRASQERAAILESMSELVVYQDTTHRILWGNRAAAESVDSSPEQLVGKLCYEVWHQRSEPCVGCPVAEARKTGKAEQAEMSTPDGRVWFVRGYPILNENGEVGAAVEVTLEISERARAEEMQSVVFQISQVASTSESLEELLQSVHEHLRRLIDTTNFLVALYDEESDLYSFPYYVDEHDQYDTISPQELRGSLTDYVRRSGRACLIDEKLDQELIRKGEVQMVGTPSRIWLGVPLKTARGVIGVVVLQNYTDPLAYSSRDLELMAFVSENIASVIERKRAEDELRRLKDFNEGIVQAVAEALLIEDAEGIITFVNPAMEKLVGYSASELVGCHWREIVPGEETEVVRAQVSQRPSGVTSQYETRLRSRVGREIPVLVSARPLLEEGTHAGVLSAFTDITERVRAEEALEKRTEELSLLYEAGHRLGRTLDLEVVCDTMHDLISRTMDCDGLYVSSYDRKEQLIHCTCARHNGKRLDVSQLPPIPLEPEGRGTQSRVIRTGEPLLIPDYEALFQSARTRYYVNDDGSVHEEIPDDAERTRSAIVVPLKDENRVIGALQVMSCTLDAYTDDDLRFLEALALQVAAASKNAMLYQQAQKEIAERVRAEDALRESEETVRAILAASPVGIGLVRNRVLDWANEAMYRMAGYEPGKLAGKSASVLYPGEEEYARVGREVYAGIADGGTGRVETRFVRKDDTVFDCILVAQALDPSDPSRGQIVAVMDITDRKRAEEAVRESEETTRALLNATTDATAVLMDLKGTILALNETAAEYLRKKVDNPIGACVYDLYPPDLAEVTKSRVDEAIRSGKATRFEDERGGRVFDNRIFPILDARGKVARVAIFGYDVTEKRRMEEELLRAEKLESVGVLAGGLAHDFNNVLTAIVGNIGLAKMCITPEEETYELLVEAERASMRAKELTQQLLTFSRGGAPIKQTTSIAELVRDSATFVLRGSNVRCQFSLPEDLWAVDADTGQISQVIQNLVINAGQAMPEGGIIQIRAANVPVSTEEGLPLDPGKYVKISVADEGIGISEEHLQRVFDPYFTTKQEGSGLGLATAYSIVRRHEGQITVESELGVGTTFYIYLPASEKRILPKKEVGEISLTGKGRILLMDDEKMVRDVAGSMLARMGYEVEFARDGAEAIEVFRAARESGTPLDAVIMDLTIPGGMGGKEAIRELLKIDPGVRAIVSSGYSTDPVMAKFGEYGFRGVVAKPYRIGQLGEELRRVLAERQE